MLLNPGRLLKYIFSLLPNLVLYTGQWKDKMLELGGQCISVLRSRIRASLAKPLSKPQCHFKRLRYRYRYAFL
jgi:hypothetical protein